MEQNDGYFGYVFGQILGLLLAVCGAYRLSAAVFLGKVSLPSHWIFFKLFLLIYGLFLIVLLEYGFKYS